MMESHLCCDEDVARVMEMARDHAGGGDSALSEPGAQTQELSEDQGLDPELD